jgi:hypothetical protein
MLPKHGVVVVDQESLAADAKSSASAPNRRAFRHTRAIALSISERFASNTAAELMLLDPSGRIRLLDGNPSFRGCPRISKEVQQPMKKTFRMLLLGASVAVAGTFPAGAQTQSCSPDVDPAVEVECRFYCHATEMRTLHQCCYQLFQRHADGFWAITDESGGAWVKVRPTSTFAGWGSTRFE